MTSQWPARGQVSSAIARRNSRGAETAARELGWLSLEDARQLITFGAARIAVATSAPRRAGSERLRAERRPSLEEVSRAVGALSATAKNTASDSPSGASHECRDASIPRPRP